MKATITNSSEACRDGLAERDENQDANLLYPSGRYDHGYPTGGIHLTIDDDIVGKTVKYVLGNIGHNLITGKFTNLLKIRTPADSHRPETYL